MKRISEQNEIRKYIQKYELDKIFKDNIIEYMELISFSKGELICSKDSDLKFMFFLVEGKIKIYTLHDNGKSILLRFSNPLSVLGDVELLTKYKVLCNVESINETIFLAVEMDKLRKYAYEEPNFLRYIIKNLGAKLYSSTNATSINLLYPLESRFASYLLSMSDYQKNMLNSIEVKIPKLIEVAPMLGTSYRHLNRIINELVRKGIIEKNKSVIFIKNLEKLEELSQGNIYEN